MLSGAEGVVPAHGHSRNQYVCDLMPPLINQELILHPSAFCGKLTHLHLDLLRLLLMLLLTAAWCSPTA